MPPCHHCIALHTLSHRCVTSGGNWCGQRSGVSVWVTVQWVTVQWVSEWVGLSAWSLVTIQRGVCRLGNWLFHSMHLLEGVIALWPMGAEPRTTSCWVKSMHLPRLSTA
jgi:hypothetical protein